MRCYCCNNPLSDYESTIRNSETNEFMDMCLNCLNTIKSEVKVIVRTDLKTEAGTDLADSIDTIE